LDRIPGKKGGTIFWVNVVVDHVGVKADFFECSEAGLPDGIFSK
jgi:hypothetical protein